MSSTHLDRQYDNLNGRLRHALSGDPSRRARLGATPGAFLADRDFRLWVKNARLAVPASRLLSLR